MYLKKEHGGQKCQANKGEGGRKGARGNRKQTCRAVGVTVWILAFIVSWTLDFEKGNDII